MPCSITVCRHASCPPLKAGSPVRGRRAEGIGPPRRIEDELREQNDRFSAAVEDMSHGLGMFDADERMIICNGNYISVGAEALMRWHSPARGLVPPDDFIPVAEETGLIVPLGEWALRKACTVAAGWPHGLRIAVNVSAVQIKSGTFARSVISALAFSGVPADRLELEITETVLMDESDTVLKTLRQLRDLGVRIALDDFGIGYSSLGYLRRFPVDKIKIDRSFIRDIDNRDTAAIVRTVIGLCAQLGTTVTAEGVETGAQLEFLRKAVSRLRAPGRHTVESADC